MDQRDVQLVALRSVTKCYREAERERRVLSDCTASLTRGERVALIGRSGSGKSTLLNIISGIDSADSGAVVIAGQDLGQLDERGRTLLRRHHIGFIFQFFNLIPTLTVSENLLLPLELVDQLTPARRQQAQSLLERVGLGDRRDDFPDRLSGGEQQRVAIARALVHRPSLLLADEPTGTLDEQTGEGVLDLLFALGGEYDMTLLMVTHSREVAARADRVLMLRDGRLESV